MDRHIRMDLRQRLRELGMAESEIPRSVAEPPFARHRYPNLTRNFGLAFSHHVGRRRLNELAKASHLAVSTVAEAITEILKLLPDPDLVDARFRQYVEELIPFAPVRDDPDTGSPGADAPETASLPESAKLLRRSRLAVDLTQTQLALALNVSQGQISRMELGVAPIPAELLAAALQRTYGGLPRSA